MLRIFHSNWEPVFLFQLPWLQFLSVSTQYRRLGWEIKILVKIGIPAYGRLQCKHFPCQFYQITYILLETFKKVNYFHGTKTRWTILRPC